MKNHHITFPQTTSIESLAGNLDPCYSAILTLDDRVLVANMNWKGQYEAAVYEFIKTPKETGLGSIECRLNLIGISDKTYKDSGHAVAWCMKQ